MGFIYSVNIGYLFVLIRFCKEGGKEAWEGDLGLGRFSSLIVVLVVVLG